MKVFYRMITLTLALVISLSFIAHADDDDDETLIESLRREVSNLSTSNANLNQVIIDLERELEDAKSNPAKGVPKRPILIVTEPLLIEIEAGKSKDIDFVLKNLTADTARNVVTTFSFPANSGISGNFTGRTTNIASVGNKATRDLSFRIDTNESTKEGFYTLTFTHKYLNDNNEDLSTESIVTVKITTPGAVGGVSLKNIAATKNTIASGEDFDLSATIENTSKTNISDISVSIEGMSSETVFLRGSANVVDVSSLLAETSHDFSVGFSAAEKIKKGSYPLTLKLSYTDSENQSQSKSYTYYVNASGVEKNENAAEVIITDISSPTEIMEVGQEFSMTATIKNTSLYEAKNVKISVAPQSEGTVVPKSTSISVIPSLAAGEEKQVTYKFAATSDSKTQNYVIGFSVEYETGILKDDDKSEINTFTQYQGVNISNPKADEEEEEEEEEKKTSTPKIIVSSYKSDPIIVRAGHEFDLDLTFLNTNAEKAVKNIKVILSVEEEVVNAADRKGSVFTPVDSSNTFYIDRIDPKGQINKHIRMYTLPDASPKNYIILVRFEYEDMENNSYEAVESVGINVKQITRLDTSEIVIDQHGMLYQPLYVNFEFYNTGKVTLSNLMVKVEGNFETSQSSMYYGSFSPSSTDYYDNQITPTEEGTQQGAIVISYEDDTGELIEFRKEFTVEVSAAMPMEEGRPEMMDPGMEDMVWDEASGSFVPAKKGLSTTALIGIGGGVALVIGAAAFIGLRMKKKKQESFDLDE